MPRRTGLDILPTLRSELPQTGVVMFTLDETVHERALALGATAVVTKDQSLDVLIAEVRRASTRGRAKPIVEPGVVLAARGVAHRALGVVLRQRRALTTLAIIAVGYAAAFLFGEPLLGPSAAVSAFLAVAIAGALLGLEWGLVSGLLISALTAVLWTGTGHQVGEPVATIGGNGIGILAIIGVGAGFGAMRMLRGRLDTEGRQASAIAEAAIFLASATGPEVLRLIASGAREAVSGDCVLIFLPVPGTGELELVASRGLAHAPLGARRVGQAVTRAKETGQTFVTDAGAASIGVEVPRMRSAVVAPLGAAPTGGVLAVLSSRRDAYRAEHVSTLAAYAAFSGSTLQAHLRVAAAEVALADAPGFRAEDRIIR
jgi:CheY-like chemotaxis protein